MIGRHDLPAQVLELTIISGGNVQHVRIEIAGDERSGLRGDQRREPAGARAPLDDIGAIKRSDGRERRLQVLLIIFARFESIVAIGMSLIDRELIGHARSITHRDMPCDACPAMLE